MLRQPLTREFAAAIAAAVEAGLGAVTPELLHLGNHTSVRLRPWPIVARIASGTSFDFSAGSIDRELAVARHLASRDAPAVRPAPEILPGPYLADDCAVTFWEFVEGRPVVSRNDEINAAASLKQIHAGLFDIDVELPNYVEKIRSCDAILSDPAEAPDLAARDRHFLGSLYETLLGKLDRAEMSHQPLHGDPHLGNVLVSGSTAIWMDLEAACIGPLEWDIASLPSAAWPMFREADPALLDLLANVRSLCVAVWCWAEFARSAETSEAAITHLDRLKARFG